MLFFVKNARFQKMPKVPRIFYYDQHFCGKIEVQLLDFAGENAWEPELILVFKWKIAQQKWSNLGSFLISSSF